MEVEEKPTKRNTILLGEATWRLKLLLKYVLVDYFHNFRCGLEHCMAFYAMWLNNFKTYQKMFLFILSRVLLPIRVPTFSSFVGEKKIVVLLRREKSCFSDAYSKLERQKFLHIKGYTFIILFFFTFFFSLSQILKIK